MIKLVFLGTAGAIPTKTRSLPSIAVEYNGKIYLFDCGEGTQRQFLKYNLNLSKVSCIFLSHIHADHIMGIPGLVRTLSINKRTEPLYIYVHMSDKDKIKSLINFDGLLLNYEVIIKPIRTGTIIKNKDIEIDAFKLNHSVITYGYIFKELDKVRFIKNKAFAAGIKGKMFQELLKKKSLKIYNKEIKLKDISYIKKGKKIAYATDTRPCKITEKKAANADILIHEATYADSLKTFAKQRKHSTTVEAANIANNAHVKMLILFHISARYKNTSKLLDETKAIFKNAEIAKDGLKIIL